MTLLNIKTFYSMAERVVNQGFCLYLKVDTTIDLIKSNVYLVKYLTYLLSLSIHHQFYVFFLKSAF